MAISTRTSSTLALELEGQAAGALRSCQPANLRVEVASAGSGTEMLLRDSVRVLLGEMAVEVDLAEPGPLVDWVQALLGRREVERSGAVVVADANLNQRRRIGFDRAVLTALNWPLLDAAETKRPFTLGLRWLAETVNDAPASGKLKLAPASKRKPMLTSNFRLLGLPFGGEMVSRVALPALSVSGAGGDRPGMFRRPGHWLQQQLGELVLDVGGRSADAARAWVHKLVADGHVDDSEGLALQVDMLDATLKNVLASITLDGCLLRGLDEDPLAGAAQAERVSGLSLRFSVEQLGLKLA